MSNIPADLKFTADDEWVRVAGEGKQVTIGITDFAQDSLSDIVYLELPEVGDEFNAGGTYGVVESVKAAADLYAPVSGKVVAVNDNLADTPELINSDPYGEAWMIQIEMSNPDEVKGLMDADAYKKSIEERS